MSSSSWAVFLTASSYNWRKSFSSLDDADAATMFSAAFSNRYCERSKTNDQG
jgi:hypothetical protein